MTNPTYWYKQNEGALYPDLIWSKPENKQQAGKLLVIGGHAHGFSAPASCYQFVLDAGIGSVRVLLPDHIKKQLAGFHGPSLELHFAPSTPSGSFASPSLAEMMDNASWANAIILAGDLGRNSETAIVLEKLVSKSTCPITITKDAVDYFTSTPLLIIDRPNTCLVLSIAQLQNLMKHAKQPTAVTYSMDLMHLVDLLHEFTRVHQIYIVVKHHDTILVAVEGKVSTTNTTLEIDESWRVSTASRVAVWWLQNPTKPFQAISSAVLDKS